MGSACRDRQWLTCMTPTSEPVLQYAEQSGQVGRQVGMEAQHALIQLAESLGAICNADPGLCTQATITLTLPARRGKPFAALALPRLKVSEVGDHRYVLCHPLGSLYQFDTHLLR